MHKPLRAALWGLSLAWLAMLVWLSSQDGAATAQTSGALTAFLARLVGVQAQSLPQLEQALRTAAHFVLYFGFGGLAWATAKATWPQAKPLMACTLLLGFALAVLDEVKKLLIPGRHLSWPEAGLNMLGVVCGALRARWLFHLLRRARAKRQKRQGH